MKHKPQYPQHIVELERRLNLEKQVYDVIEKNKRLVSEINSMSLLRKSYKILCDGLCSALGMDQTARDGQWQTAVQKAVEEAMNRGVSMDNIRIPRMKNGDVIPTKAKGASA